MSRKKILFVISSLSTGGAQKAFANISLSLPDEWDCDFLINSSEEVSYHHRGQVFDLGLSPQEDKTRLIYLIQVFLKRLSILYKLKKGGGYTACISGLSSANMANALIKDKKCKTITSIRIHMSQQFKNENSFKSFLERITVIISNVLSEKIVTVSESARYDLTENYFARASKTISIYNGYDLEYMREMAKAGLSKKEEDLLFSSIDTKILVNVGRLESQKCQFSLIRIFKEINKHYPHTKLVIMGTGSLFKKLKNFIKKLGLEGRVILWGFESNPYRIMARSYLFLMTSLFEGFPNTIVESMSLGIPVISTDCDSGPREILAPDIDIHKKVNDKPEMAKYGVLCPVLEDDKTRETLNDSEKVFVKAVIKLLEDAELYDDYSRAAIERSNDFSGDMIIKNWISIME